METTKDETPAYVINSKQAKACTEIAKKVYDALHGKGGLDDIMGEAEKVKTGISFELARIYQEAEKVGKGNHAVQLSAFQSLCTAFEAALVTIDAGFNDNVKRTVYEVYPSWRVMKSEMKRAIQAGIPAAKDGKPLAYSEIKAERAKVDPSAGKRTARTADTKAAPTADKGLAMTPALEASIKSLFDLVPELDLREQNRLAEAVSEMLINFQRKPVPESAKVVASDKKI